MKTIQAAAILTKLLHIGLIFVLFLFFAIEWAIVATMNYLWLYIYTFIMFGCLMSLGIMLFPKISRKAYLFFAAFFFAFLIMYNYVPTIKEQHHIDRCLDLGNVWDSHTKKCREDCLKWTEENGCLKE